jgi:phytoene desaturase (3,4-didehydrolycopene-forming)
MSSSKTAIVIGAGVGGVATAARLAKAGFRVVVVEKNDFTGGRCSLIHKDGHVCYISRCKNLTY